LAETRLKTKPDERKTLYEAALALDFTPAVATALARVAHEASWRATRLAAHLDPELKDMAPPGTLPDIGKAAERVALALRNREVIGLVCDHDADGTTSAIIYIKALTEVFAHPRARVRLYVSHRLNEGYGLCEPVAERILSDQPRPSLILTADCGSHDGERIIRIKEAAGAETVVTDHHSAHIEVPGAYAFVNPKRADAGSGPDPNIAGCMVAWCLMAHTFRVVHGGERNAARTRLVRLLDYAALGTVADCVDISTPTNRAVIRYGLKRMSLCSRPCWRVCKEWLRLNPDEAIRAEDIAYQVAPRIASTGRLDESRPGIYFLGAASLATARRYGNLLEEANNERKQIQAEMLEKLLETLPEPTQMASRVVVAGSRNGHAGIQGIVASRLAETYRRPAFVMTLPPGTKGWRGSARSGDSGICLVNVKSPGTSLMGRVAATHPDLFERFGGHHAAAGMILRDTEQDTLIRFTEALNEAALELGFEPRANTPVQADSELDLDEITPGLVTQLDRIEPTGKGLRRPIFAVKAFRSDPRPFKSGSPGANIFLSKQPGANTGLRVGVFDNRMLQRIEDSSGADPWIWVVEIGVFKGHPSLSLRAAYPPQARGAIS